MGNELEKVMRAKGMSRHFVKFSKESIYQEPVNADRVDGKLINRFYALTGLRYAACCRFISSYVGIDNG